MDPGKTAAVHLQSGLISVKSEYKFSVSSVLLMLTVYQVPSTGPMCSVIHQCNKHWAVTAAAVIQSTLAIETRYRAGAGW